MVILFIGCVLRNILKSNVTYDLTSVTAKSGTAAFYFFSVNAISIKSHVVRKIGQKIGFPVNSHIRYKSGGPISSIDLGLLISTQIVLFHSWNSASSDCGLYFRTSFTEWVIRPQWKSQKKGVSIIWFNGLD